MQTVTAYPAEDGTLFRTEEDANKHNKRKLAADQILALFGANDLLVYSHVQTDSLIAGLLNDDFGKSLFTILTLVHEA